MNINLWFFLTVCVLSSMVFVMFVMYLSHKRAMKQLEIEALKQGKCE